MRAFLDFQSFLIILLTRSILIIRNYQCLSAHRSPLISHRSSIHLLPPLFYEGLHIGGYFALEIHLLACSGMGET